MKKIGVLLLVIISLFGCTQSTLDKNYADNPDDEQIKVVEAYNKAIFSKNWREAKKYLDGKALEIFNSNINNYSQSTTLISQINFYEAKDNIISIVNSCIDFMAIDETNTKTYTRSHVRFFVEKSDVWKITKVEEIPYIYQKDMKYTPSEKDDITKQVVKDFIEASAKGDIKKASKYLSGRLLAEAKRYKMDNLPQTKIKDVTVSILTGTDKEQLARAEYVIQNDKKLNLTFRLINIDYIWLIDEIIY